MKTTLSEDKWKWDRKMREKGLPYIAPVIEDIKTIVIRDQNVEGGMGVHFYDNALHGG